MKREGAGKTLRANLTSAPQEAIAAIAIVAAVIARQRRRRREVASCTRCVNVWQEQTDRTGRGVEILWGLVSRDNLLEGELLRWQREGKKDRVMDISGRVFM